MSERQRITIFVLHDDSPADFEFVLAWIEKWKSVVSIADYSTGGWEHLWDIEAPAEAIIEVPEEWLCLSDWSSSHSGLFGNK
ncbi:hypothetical protein [Rouxiella sp. Mn2063]|uniref:hypothetical protein n=1 Tax=Rouxiella sp. Mn2063 TaxID=3395262 RepID=UPI003BCEC5E5